MDKFCEFYDVMKDELESYMQLYDEIKNANLTVRDSIEGLKYARWLESMKYEYGILQYRLQQMRSESFHVWQRLQGLKQEKDHFHMKAKAPKPPGKAVAFPFI